MQWGRSVTVVRNPQYEILAENENGQCLLAAVYQSVPGNQIVPGNQSVKR